MIFCVYIYIFTRFIGALLPIHISAPQVKQVVEVAQAEAGFLRKKQVEASCDGVWRAGFGEFDETGTATKEENHVQVCLCSLCNFWT